MTPIGHFARPRATHGRAPRAFAEERCSAQARGVISTGLAT